MGLNLNMNAMNQIVKGVTIFEEKEPVESIGLVLKGRVLVSREGVRTILGTGNFLGICDIYAGSSSVSYTAFDNTVIYPFPVKGAEDINTILEANKEYGGLMAASLSRYIRDLYSIYLALIAEAESMYDLLTNYYEVYKASVKKNGIRGKGIEALESLEQYEKTTLLDLHKAKYYSECAGIAIDVQKAFYQKNVISMYHIEEQTEVARQIILECSEVAVYIRKLMKSLLSDSPDCLFKRIVQLLMDLKKEGSKPDRDLSESVDRMVEKINETETLFEEKVGTPLEIDREELENLYYIIISGGVPSSEMESGVKAKLDSLKGTLNTILAYGEISKEQRDEITELIETYKSLKDKLATDDGSRRLRNNISRAFYEIYEKVFKKAFHDRECPLCVDLFLKFGLMDETLMRDEQLEDLVELEDIKEKSGPCRVYNMKEWLTLVYKGKKLPSKSEFDVDYEEHIRSRRKNNELTEEEAKKELVNMDARLNYEIFNMFKSNNRLVSGQISTFVPFLHEDSFITGIKKAYVTSDSINEAVEYIRSVDYSLFFREFMYDNEELEIKREYIKKEVFPDIILLPSSGETPIMWQEMSGRRRDSKGRFLFPVFNIKNLEETIVKIAGRYRWELCRTTQGATWNNIKYRSLTSEYMDYIQFYRKNRELSEEKKEKLKTQIQKSRSNSREVFVGDYEAWVRNEASGSVRLNKVAREMLATYCPFERTIRERLKSQPMFADAMVRYNREKAIRLKELDLRQRVLEKEGKEVPKEMADTIAFFRDM